MRLGVHVPIAGGLLEAVARATRLSCTTMQIFSRSPRGGAAPALSRADCERFDAQRRKAGIEPLAIHAPYVMNLASPEASMWKRSTALYRDEYARAASLKAEYLVTHVGSHRGEGEEAGIARVAQAVSRALDPAIGPRPWPGAHPGMPHGGVGGVSPRRGRGVSGAAGLPAGLDHRRGSDNRGMPPVMILLENTAGAGQGLGHRFEQLADIRERVQGNERVGVCLDTAHLFAAGYPIHTADGLEETIASFDRIVGLEHLQLIHLNDSKVPFDSHVDRHWHIGEGHIGLEPFRRLVNHPALRDLPFILETPKKTEREDRRNLTTVRALVRAVGRARRARAATA